MSYSEEEMRIERENAKIVALERIADAAESIEEALGRLVTMEERKPIYGFPYHSSSSSVPCSHIWEDHYDMTVPYRRCLKCLAHENLSLLNSQSRSDIAKSD